MVELSLTDSCQNYAKRCVLEPFDRFLETRQTAITNYDSLNRLPIFEKTIVISVTKAHKVSLYFCIFSQQILDVRNKRRL